MNIEKLLKYLEAAEACGLTQVVIPHDAAIDRAALAENWLEAESYTKEYWRVQRKPALTLCVFGDLEVRRQGNLYFGYIWGTGRQLTTVDKFERHDNAIYVNGQTREFLGEWVPGVGLRQDNITAGDDELAMTLICLEYMRNKLKRAGI